MEPLDENKYSNQCPKQGKNIRTSKVGQKRELPPGKLGRMLRMGKHLFASAKCVINIA